MRLDEVQVIGSHNSYHRRPASAVLARLEAFDPALPRSIDFEHAPLDVQLMAGIRQFELDVFADPDGGRYSTPAAERLLGPDPRERDPEARRAELDRPGFKVLHLPDVDFRSTCPSFVSCLRTIERWSARHPDHLPIAVFVEPKVSALPDLLRLGFVTPAPIGEVELAALDAEVRSVFARERLLTPDDVRGDADTLVGAVTTTGWPTLEQARGRVLFCLLDGDTIRAAYVRGHPSLRGRVMFTTSGADAPEAAIVSRPDPVASAADIRSLVERGFLVRTRADVDTVEARAGDRTRRDAAFASGAHWVSTDYPFPDAALGNGYQVRFEDGRYARCHPTRTSADCRPDALEGPTR